MSDSSGDDASPVPKKGGGGGGGGGKNRMSVERIYQKKTQLEHILLRPDTYIGSVEPVTQSMWVYDGEEAGFVYRDVTFVPGLYKIFDEILVNAADNKQRCAKMDVIKVDIDSEKNDIKIYNNGTGIPVVQHKVEKMFVPSLIFGHLLTSSNYNDEEKKVTGGRNGYGAKLCNIFSNKFVVETSCKKSGKCFKQTWKNNMSIAEEPIIKSNKGEDFTSIHFSPDLSKFKMSSLDKDIVAIMSRRAYDIAGTSRGVKVYLNGKRLPVKGFKDYVDLMLKGKMDEQGNPLKVVYENVGTRWEVAATCSDKGLQQVSFVNSIATTKGGRHVDHVLEQIVSKIVEGVKKKTSKAGIAVKPFQIKNHLWVFVNCLIENPTFDSQTKENMTLQAKSFGSKCTLTDKFMTGVVKCGVMEAIMSWVQFKSQTQLNQKCSSRTLSKLKGMPKLEDANNAGTKNGVGCTLILTEGDSAKSLAVSGLSVIGRDNFGVFPLKGKILNVREATHKQILENAEINNIIKIMGLQYKKKYESLNDLKTLRYGRLMIMTDQDQDGSHIKGLLINFIHHNWPGLLRLPFLEEFITPIVKVKKDRVTKSFYSLPEFEEWKSKTDNWNKWTAKYYKGLGTSSAAEAREYFHDMQRHRIMFKYDGPRDDNAIRLAFSKKMIEQRKEWLTSSMEDRRNRREMGLPEIFLYEKNTSEVSYQDFVNKELVLFSNMDNERSIPSMLDGLKPGQRKIMFTCFKRNLRKELKVAQLAGSVSEKSAYHHGEVSLMNAIINLAQNFVGSNNLNLLVPIGQFGTRLQGGKDAASPRYIFTKLSSLSFHIFNKYDEDVLTHQHEDNLKIEPEFYVPIIPMILVNGASGIGTGWMTSIPNYDVREIVANIRRLIRGTEVVPMLPSFKNFKGTIIPMESARYLVSGEISILNEKTIEITELPVHVWTQAYKESVLEVMLHGSEKIQPVLTDYKEYHTDTTVRFVVTMTEERLKKAEAEGLHKFFKLQSTFSTSSMVCFDHLGTLKTYKSAEDILRDFFVIRLEYYVKRKAFMEGMLKAESLKLNNQARFIVEKIDGILVLENKKRQEIIATLIAHKFDPDPVRQWKLTQNKDEVLAEEAEDAGSEEEEEGEAVASKPKSVADQKSDYDYLMQLNMWNLSREKKEQLLKQRDLKKEELDILMAKTPADLWQADLDNFLVEFDHVEIKESEAELASATNTKGKKGGSSKGSVKVKKAEVMPSPHGKRVVPLLDSAIKKKFEWVDRNKARMKKKGDADTDLKTEDTLSDGEMKPLSERIKAEKDDEPKKKGLKQTKLSFTSAKKDSKRPARNPWSETDSESEVVSLSNSDDESSSPPLKKARAAPRRAAATAKRMVDSDSEIDGNNGTMSDDDFAPSKKNSKPLEKNNDVAVTKNGTKTAAAIVIDSDSDSYSKPPERKDEANQSLLFDSLLDDGAGASDKQSPPTAATAQLVPKKYTSSSDSDSDAVSSPPPKKGKAATSSKPAASKKRVLKKAGSSSDSDSDIPKRKKAVVRKPLSKKKQVSSESEEEMMIGKKNGKAAAAFEANPRARSARSKAPISYNFGDSGESDF